MSSQYDALLEKAGVLSTENDFEASCKLYDEAIAIFPERPEAYKGKGNLYFAESRFDEAEALYEKAIEKDVSYWSAYFNLGIVYERRQNWEKARYYYYLALEYSSENFKILNALGTLEFKLRNLDSALVYYEKALGLEPENPKVLCNIGEILLEQGVVSKAIAFFNDSIQKGYGIQFPAIFDWLAEAYMLNGDNTLAIESLIKFNELVGENVNGYIKLYKNYEKQDNHAEAIMHLERALIKHGTDLELMKCLVNCYFATGKYESAVKILLQMLPLETDSKNLYLLGSSYALLENFEMANKYLDLALGIEPGNTNCLYLKGCISFEMAEYATALQYFEATQALLPEFEECVASIKKTLDKLGRPNEL